MVQHRIHHLLVLADGRLVGIVDMLGLCTVSLDLASPDLPLAPGGA
jgi:signal-transduction protein with cAMP-binding, CBS, and nucleotidyltransferase domain